MEFGILGPIQVLDSGRLLSLGGPKQRSVLALIVAGGGDPVAVDRIVDATWGAERPPRVHRSLHTYVSNLRSEMGEVIDRVGDGYALRADRSQIDWTRFEDLATEGVSLVGDDPAAASPMLREALSLWRGHAYADIDGRGLLEPEITRLTELRVATLQSRIDADLALGLHAELIGELEAMTLEHPLQERFRAQHMLALYRAGRQADALRAYERTRAHLSEELGLDPSPDLSRLEQRILEHDAALDLAPEPSVVQSAVVVVQAAEPRSLMNLEKEMRVRRVERILSAFTTAAEAHSGSGFARRGTALYATFATVRDAVAAIADSRTLPLEASAGTRTAVDIGDVELHESGEVTGPPVRRAAGLVAAAHGEQVLLSAAAQEALASDGDPGRVVRSLGTYTIHGLQAPQQVFQLVLDGQSAEFPPLRHDGSPPPLPIDRPAAVAGYELRVPLSADLLGTTYRAYQASAGREVHVMVIDPIWSNEPGFVRRFEVETQLVTRLQHPHILALLDYWRDPSGAYLVTRPARGGTLADALGAQPIDAPRAGDVLVQIGSALADAHAHGLVHGTTSPHCVVFDESGNAYLTGSSFLTRLAGAPPAMSVYAAPEYLGGGPVTMQTDVYGLGRLAGELLGASAPVSDAVARATASDPAERFASVGELLAALRLDGHERNSVFTASRNPYKGLEAFAEADAGDFFGREEAVEELVTRLAEHRLVAVVGPSGSGKSSLVKAGVIPAVRAGAVDGSPQWVITDMYPGSYPLEELESALTRVAVEDPGSVLDELDRDERRLGRVIRRIIPPDTRLLLVIDQFEEVFTLTHDPASRDRLLGALVALAADERSDTRVVITLRADYFDRPLEHPAFGELLEAGMVALTTPRPDHLAEAIRRPAEGVGVTWEPGLVEQIVDDVADAPGTLPLLQYALTEVFAARQADLLTFEGYRAAGGVLGALWARADDVFTALDQRRRRLARQILLRLVSVHHSSEATRRRARLIELNAVGDPSDVHAVLTAFGDARLITFDRDPVTRGPTAEVAHEALLTRWPRLADWIAEAEEDLLLHQRLVDAVEEWREKEADDGYLLSGGRLAQFAEWAASTQLTLTREELQYLSASREQEDRRSASRRRRRLLVTTAFAGAALIASILAVLALVAQGRADEQAELATANEEAALAAASDAETERRRAQREADAARAAEDEANRQADLARSRELAAAAISTLDQDPELSLLLTLQAAQHAESPADLAAALQASLNEHRKIYTYTWPAAQGFQDLSTRISPDGRLLLASAGGRYVEVVEIDSGEPLWSFEFPGNGIVRADFTRDGTEVVATYGWSSGSRTALDADTRSSLGVHRFDASTGTHIGHLDVGTCGVVTRPEAMATAGTGADSVLLVQMVQDDGCQNTGSPGADTTAPTWLIDLTTVAREPIGEAGELVHLAGEAGHLLVGGMEQATSRVIERTTGVIVSELQGFPAGISADGTAAFTFWEGGPDGEQAGLYAWDVASSSPGRLVVPVDDLLFFGGSVSSTGSLFASLGQRSSIALWDATAGVQLDPLRTGLDSNDQISFSADGSRLVVNEVFGATAAVFDLDVTAAVDTATLCAGQIGIQTGHLDRAGDMLTTLAQCDGLGSVAHQFVVDAATLEVTSVIEHEGGLRSALSADGRLVATQLGEPPNIVGEIVLRSTSDGTVVTTLEGLCTWPDGADPPPECAEFPNAPFPDWPWDLDFSPDGSYVAMAGQNTDAVVVWDTATRQIVATPTVEHNTEGPDNVLDVEFSPSGDRIAASFVWTPKELWMISTEDWTPVAQYAIPAEADTDEAPSHNLLFTPDGSTLIGTDFSIFGDGRIVFMDGTTLEHLAEIPDAHDTGIGQLALNDDGTLLASAGLDGLVRVWDVESRALLHEARVTAGHIGGIAFMDDQQHLAVTNLPEGTLEVITIDPDELLDRARCRITRAFTETECAAHRIDPCPTLEEMRTG